jgi:uncharacterized protein
MNKSEILKYLADHKSEFRTEFGVKRIGLFGSYATGEAEGDSDIDIVVEMDKPDLFKLIGIKQAIEEEIGLHVDVVRYRDRMNKALKRRIDRDSVYV